MGILIGAEKVFDKFHHAFMIKTLNKLGTEGTFSTIKSTYVKAIYESLRVTL